MNKPLLSHLTALPAVGDVWPQLLLTHHLPHFLHRWIGLDQVKVGQLVVLVNA